MKKVIIGLMLATALTACSRVETGEVGVRVGMDKQIEKTELQPGSLNQTIFGDVLIFPVKDVQVDVYDLTPLAADNSTVSDFDLIVVYSINPTSVSELYINKNRGFHAQTEGGETLLMYNYVQQLGRNAAYKVARKYESLKMSDNRAEIEQLIVQEMRKSLAAEGLDKDIVISQALVKQIKPDKSIVASANALVKAQNEQKQKKVEVETAKLEAERIAALNANAGATEYMAAMAAMNISEGIRDGKVQTIVVPMDFKGMINTK